MNRLAQAYVSLVLAVGQHDARYVDAFYGPVAWRERAQAERKSLAAIKQAALLLLAALQELHVQGQEEIVQLRRHYLVKQTQALLTYVEMLEGTRLTFDDESRALYDAVAPPSPATHCTETLARLETLLAGNGPLVQRYERFRHHFIIPRHTLETVFTAAIAEARRRTKQHIDLPAQERCEVEYVTDQPWSGYTWYKGNNHSVMQINTDFPMYIDRALDLGAHEGYPGHHVYNVLRDQRLVQERGWVEFSVYALFSPQSLIAEGSANYGLSIAFPGVERVAFEREVLFPLAGLDPAHAEEYDAVRKLVTELSDAENEAARRYVNGEMSADETVAWLAVYALMPRERARQRVQFIDRYRSYVINYNLGQKLVKQYIEAQGGTAAQPEKRWEAFTQLLASPRLPSGLQPVVP
jgi:hypothetical protein